MNDVKRLMSGKEEMKWDKLWRWIRERKEHVNRITYIAKSAKKEKMSEGKVDYPRESGEIEDMNKVIGK